VLDLKALRDDPQPVKDALARRDPALPAQVDRLLVADARRRELTVQVEDLRAEQNRGSKAVSSARGDQRAGLISSLKEVSARLDDLQPRLTDAEEEVAALLARLPNPPHATAPEGATDDDNQVLREVGERPVFGFDPRDHADLGNALGIIDVERAARVSGSRFAYLLGEAAWLQWALVRYCLDTLAPRGFVPVIPPVLVREEAMRGTGFLPTDEAQIYVTRDDELYLAGTSEVPLAGLHMGEILEADVLPRRYVGYSTCFRREAGTYGKDTGGIFRVHQFDKVEMFSFTMPDASWEEHEFLLSCEEGIVGGLGLPYRVVSVATGELGASAAKKYDIEVWLPGQDRYRELTSCSNCTDYQACAVGRMLIAILENFQRQDGSVEVPQALHPYLPEEVRVLTPA